MTRKYQKICFKRFCFACSFLVSLDFDSEFIRHGPDPASCKFSWFSEDLNSLWLKFFLNYILLYVVQILIKIDILPYFFKKAQYLIVKLSGFRTFNKYGVHIQWIYRIDKNCFWRENIEKVSKSFVKSIPDFSEKFQLCLSIQLIFIIFGSQHF